MSKRKRIAIDMDETICDTMTRHLDWYNQEFKQALKKSDLLATKIYDKVPPEHKATVKAYPNRAEFFADLEPLPNAIQVIQELHKDYDIFIATAAMEHPNSFATKFEWLRAYLPFISPLNYVFCGDKNIVQADYLIDDSSRHFKYFRGQGLLFSAPHNMAETGFHRVNDWLEIKAYFQLLNNH